MKLPMAAAQETAQMESVSILNIIVNIVPILVYGLLIFLFTRERPLPFTGNIRPVCCWPLPFPAAMR